jgi:hypothetical protein
VADDGVLSVGREAICAGGVDKPVKEDVPPGRYWPGGDVMLTVEAATVEAATVAVSDGMVLDCGPIGVVAVGVAGGWKSWVVPVAGIAWDAVAGDAAGSASA